MKEFFHASRDIKFLKSFLHEGAKAIGKGVGGQASGFYVYSNKKLAVEHFNFLKNKKAISDHQEGILVAIKVDEKDLKYPDWQFDYEANPDVIGLLENFAPMVVNALKKIKGIKNAKKTKRFGRFEIEFQKRGKIISKAISPIDPEITDFTGIWQWFYEREEKRVKRRGKSPPHWLRDQWQDKPYRKQGQTQTDGDRINCCVKRKS